MEPGLFYYVVPGEVFVVDVDRGTTRQFTHTDGVFKSAPEWSANGASISTRSTRAGGRSGSWMPRRPGGS